MKTITTDSGVRDEVAHHIVCAAKAAAPMRRTLRIGVGEAALEAVFNYGAVADTEELTALLRSARYRKKLYACAVRDVLTVSARVLEARRIDQEHALAALGAAVELHMAATRTLPACACSLHRVAA